MPPQLLSGAGNVWPSISALRGSPRLAAIPFLGEGAPALLPQFGSGDIIVCDASDGSIKNGLTSAKALAEFIDRGVHLYWHTKLHAKVVAIGRTAVIGSMNGSQNSAGIEEAAVLTTDPSLAREVRSLIRRLAHDAITLDPDAVKRLATLAVRNSGSGGGTKVSESALPILVAPAIQQEPPKYVDAAITAKNASERKPSSFVISGSWGAPGERKRRGLRPSGLLLWIIDDGTKDPRVDIARILECELIRKRWVYYEVIPAKRPDIRLSQLKTLLAGRGYQGKLSTLSEEPRTVRLDGFEDDLRKLFGKAFPPSIR